MVAKEVWPGIDVEYRLQSKGIETVFRVQPGADWSQVVLEYEGLDAPLRVDANGNLILSTSLGEIQEQAPFAFQNHGRVQKAVPVWFRILSDTRYGFVCDEVDASRELVIDPLVYGSYLGGYGPDELYDVEVAQTGHVLVCGGTEADDFPVTPGAYQTEMEVISAFVCKLSPLGDSLLFATYFGTWTSASAAGVDVTGRIYAGGGAERPRVPLTPDAWDTTFAGGTEGFLARFSADGTTLEYSTYIGGITTDIIYEMQMDTEGILYLCGDTNSDDFPVTADALFPSAGVSGGFLAVFDPSVSTIRYSTCIPSDSYTIPWDIELVAPGWLWIAGFTETGDLFPVTEDAVQPLGGGGRDGFFSLWDLNENRLVYSSFLGGVLSEYLLDLSVVDSERIVLTGYTYSEDFPVTPGAWDTSLTGITDAFVTIVHLPDTLEYSTLLGGSEADDANGVAVDNGSITVLGNLTNSPDFPVTPGAYDTVLNGNGQPGNSADIFIVRMDRTLSHVLYGTFWGGAGSDEGYRAYFVDPDTVWFGGRTWSGDLPVTPNAVQQEAMGIGDGWFACFALPPMDTTFITPTPFVPSEFAFSVYPNPFNPTTVFSFTLPQPSSVKLRVFNLLGQVVYTTDLGRLSSGEHHHSFNGRDLPSGLYFARAEAAGMVKTKKVVLLR
ncbi:MAG: T9SS type A sorting domain-containing protein [bacterium]|nr:T9SS type A sorting domain-containing protein [bacterium]